MARVILRPNSQTDLYEWRQRIDGCVCTNGTFICATQFTRKFKVTRKDGSSDLTPQEVATFVRNFLEEGFSDPIEIEECE